MRQLVTASGGVLLDSSLAPIETFRNVLLVALILGLAWVLFQRMAHAMRKRDDIPHEWVDFDDASVRWEGRMLRIGATSKAPSIEKLVLRISDPRGVFDEILFEGPVEEQDLAWEWPFPQELIGSLKSLEIEIATAHTKVIRRVAIPEDVND